MRRIFRKQLVAVVRSSRAMATVNRLSRVVQLVGFSSEPFFRAEKAGFLVGFYWLI